MTEAFTAWLVALMLVAAPPGRSHLEHARETPDEGRARYVEIAQAIAEVSLDPAEAPLLGGPRGRAQTAAVLAAVALYESAYRRDVDLGLGPQARGSGVDTCLLQIRLGRGQTTREGWSAADLVTDRRKCLRAGMRLMRRSFAACRKLPIRERLGSYAAGDCMKGRAASRKRMAKAWEWAARAPSAVPTGARANPAAPPR